MTTNVLAEVSHWIPPCKNQKKKKRKKNSTRWHSSILDERLRQPNIGYENSQEVSNAVTTKIKKDVNKKKKKTHLIYGNEENHDELICVNEGDKRRTT